MNQDHNEPGAAIETTESVEAGPRLLITVTDLDDEPSEADANIVFTRSTSTSCSTS